MTDEPTPLSPRRKSRPLHVGDVQVGGDAPIVVQSMTSTDTADANATVEQIARLADAGSEIVRIAVPDKPRGGRAARRSCSARRCPLIADIHFDYRWALAAIARRHPRPAPQPRQHPRRWTRCGGREGSEGARHPDPHRRQRRLPAADPGTRRRRAAAVDGPAHGRRRALGDRHPRGDGLRRHQDLDEGVRRADDGRGLPRARRRASPTRCTSASPRQARRAPAPCAASIGIGILLAEGIGDTIRVSLAADPVEEIPVC